jgi:capsular polysaccharide transport system permease protein
MRNHWEIHKSVMSALFLREAITRLSAGRISWVWILLEPLAHVVFLMLMFGFVFHRMVNGVEGAMFVMTGLLGFITARNTATRSAGAVSANAALFAYRQVLPVDTVLVRAALEGFLMLLSAVVLLAGAGLVGFNVVPHDPLLVVAAFAGLWLCGAGLGLVLSVVAELLPEVSKLVNIAFIPLYFISGVMVPAMAIPQPYREWALFNPFLHGLEMLRAGFFLQFHPAPEAGLSYLYGFALMIAFLGMALHVRYAERMVAQ